MRQASEQARRGIELDAATLRAVLADTTWAQRYQSFPNGKRGDYRLYRRTLTELDSLSNRQLRDLGLSRHSVCQVAYDSVYGA